MQSLLKTAAAITALTLPITALAEQSMSDKDKQRQWSEMRAEAVSASEILTGDVTNVLNAVGNVKELILTEDSRKVEYILYDVPYPYGFYGTDDGFVAFDNVALEHGGFGDINARFDDQADARAPEQLKLTASQVDHRAVSRLVGEQVVFQDDAVRTLSDMLVHPETGMVTHFVVEMNPNAIFATDNRAIPANMVRIKRSGLMQVSVTVDKALGMKEYDPSML